MTPRSLARRAALIVVLWLGFWLLACGLVIGLLAIPLAQLRFRDSIDLSGIVAACAGLTAAYVLRPRRAAGPDANAVQTQLRRDEAPSLFAFVDGIAARVGVQAPFEIHLVTAATASISAERSWTGRVRKLSIALGLPLFGCLSEPELGAVIVHEFGHFIGGDVILTPWVHRTRATVAHAIHALDDSVFFLDAPFRWYGNWFLRQSGAVSRAQEYSADLLSARHFGADAAGAALEKVHALGPLWSAYFDHDLVPALNCSIRIPVFDGFRRFRAASPKRRDVQHAIDHAEDRTVSAFDTHPSLDERLAALGRAAAGDLAPAGSMDLVGGEDHLESLWYARIRGSGWPAVPWEAFGNEVLRPRIAQRFSGTPMAPEAMPLTDLVKAAQSLDDWWLRLRPEGPSLLSQEGKRRHVRSVLRDWIIASLCHAGFMLRVRPGAGVVLERDGEKVDPDALLADACAGALDTSMLAAYAA